MNPSDPLASRRPLKTRSAGWAIALAAALVRSGVAPNAISVMSALSAAVSGACLVLLGRFSSPAGQIILLIAAAVGIQLRLLCNMLDGMVAVEGGRRTPTGELYNEIPDRIADTLILAGAGYAAGRPEGVALGWSCAALAILTAYLRALAASLGLPALFLGPLAKPQRMAVMTIGCLAAAAAVPWRHAAEVITASLLLIAVGTAITCVRRTRALAIHLRQR